MSTTRPLSPFNRIFIPALAAAAIAALVQGEHGVGIAVLVAVTFAGISIWRAQRGLGSELERVNALQPYDERDGALARRGFSYLGQAVFIAQTLVFLYAAVTHGDVPGEAIRLGAVCVVSIAANYVAVKRG